MTQSFTETPSSSESTPPAEPQTRFPAFFLLVGLLLSIAVDQLFWKKPVGISIAIWVLLTLGGLFVLAWREKVRPPVLSLVLAGGIVLMTAVTALRMEGFTRFINTFLALGGLVLLAATFTTGHWFYYRVIDYVVPLLATIFGGLGRPGRILTAATEEGEEGEGKSALARFFGHALPVLRGILIAAPIILLLGALLSAADMVFYDRLKDFFELFKLERLPEYLFRLFYILVLGYTFIGIYLQAVLPRKTAARPDPQRTWIKPFLGWTETAIVLGSIILLFAVFVSFQFRYLFGGQANITAAGYTYSEYARRGFGELVAVAVLSLLIYLCLAAVSRKETTGQQRGFSILSSLLVLLVLVILASSLQRMLLYEAAYGFTRLRTYTHVFIFCLATLLIATIALEVTGKRGRFGLALLVFSLVFSLALGVMNVDGFIARQNIQRTLLESTQTKSLDDFYLSELSSDAVPVMVKAFNDPQLSSRTHDVLGAELACRLAITAQNEPMPWQGYHPANARAIRLMNGISPQLFKDYPVHNGGPRGLYVELGQETHNCYENTWID
jgi:hypothetical protein